jgi:lysophospholipase L1-like esterase
MRHVRAIVVVLLANVALLAAGELFARWTHLPDRMNGFPRRTIEATDDPDLPYHLRPNVDTIARGMHVRINEHALRGPSTPLEPPPGVHRVLAIGGSTTFGEGLEEEESFPGQLERELNASGDGQRYEVLNAGVEGYNSTAELAFLRQLGLPLKPRTVVIGYSLDDFQDSPVMGPYGILTRTVEARVPTCSLGNASALYLSVYWFAKTGFKIPWHDLSAQRPRLGDDVVDLDRALARQRKQAFRKQPDAQWNAMVDALHGFAREAAAHDLRLVLAVMPDGDQVGVPDPDLIPQQKIRAICADAGLDCLDLQPALDAAAAHEKLFFDGAHPNAAGQRVIAQALAAHLRSLD